MSVMLKELEGGKVLEVNANGTLSKDDYSNLVPAVERLIHDHGRINILFSMDHFHGWSPGGLWEDMKFDVHHFGDIQRLALVGDKRWEKWMARFCRPFTSAKIRYFDRQHTDEARGWVSEN
jgi:hypothetical protein